MKIACYYIMRSDGYAWKDNGKGLADKDSWDLIRFTQYETREKAQKVLDAFDPTHDSGFTVEVLYA